MHCCHQKQAVGVKDKEGCEAVPAASTTTMAPAPAAPAPAGTITESFRLMPRNPAGMQPRPVGGPTMTASRGRKRRSGAIQQQQPATTSLVPPMNMVSFVPPATASQPKSVVSPATVATGCGAPQPRCNKEQQHHYTANQCEDQRRLPEPLRSPVGNLDGAAMTLKGLSLHSPSPSPSSHHHHFQHQDKSSPFSVSSHHHHDHYENHHNKPSLLSPLMNCQSSLSSPPPMMLGSPMMMGHHHPHKMSTPSPKTAPLTVVTHTPMKGTHTAARSFELSSSAPRKRPPPLPTDPDKFMKSPKTSTSPLFGPPKESKDEEKSRGKSVAGKNKKNNESSSSLLALMMGASPTRKDPSAAGASPMEGLASPTTPLPRVALHPRSPLRGSRGSQQRPPAAATIFASPPPELHLPSRPRQSPILPSSALYPPGQATGEPVQPPVTADTTKATPAAANLKKSGDTPLTQSDVSFIPLPDWNDDLGMMASTSPLSPPKKNMAAVSPQKKGNTAVSLLHPPSMGSGAPDPIDELLLETTGSSGTKAVSLLHPPPPPAMNNRGAGGSLLLDTAATDNSHFLLLDDMESLSDHDADSGFLLVAPRDIEQEKEERQEDHHRPSKHARLRPSGRALSASPDDDNDCVPPLPKLQPPPTTGTAVPVPTRDLVTPPAMSQSNSPPPLHPTAAKDPQEPEDEGPFQFSLN